MGAPQSQRELYELLDRLCVGAISDDERRKLNDLLRTSDEACLIYLRYMALHSSLSFDARELSSLARAEVELAADDSPSKPLASPSDMRSWLDRALRPPMTLSLVAAALVIGLLIAAMAFMAPPFYRKMVEEEQPRGRQAPMVVALLANSFEADWVEGQTGTHNGARLLAGQRMDLKQGRALVLFKDGTRVWLTGPAVFEPNSAKTGTLQRGTLSALCEGEARGFSVATPAGVITDLGTKFGVFVDERGATEVHVFDGRVEVESKTVTRVLAANDASLPASLALDVAGNVRLIPSALDRFPFSLWEPEVVALKSPELGQLTLVQAMHTLSPTPRTDGNNTYPADGDYRFALPTESARFRSHRLWNYRIVPKGEPPLPGSELINDFALHGWNKTDDLVRLITTHDVPLGEYEVYVLYICQAPRGNGGVCAALTGKPLQPFDHQNGVELIALNGGFSLFAGHVGTINGSELSIEVGQSRSKDPRTFYYGLAFRPAPSP